MIAVAKEKINEIVAKQPEDSSYDEIMRELVFTKMIDDGLDDARNNRVIKHCEMKKELDSWLK